MEYFKKWLNRFFIDGLSGMALGLFSTLIIGTILCQVGSLLGTNTLASFFTTVGSVAKTLTGAGIGVGVALKLHAKPLTAVSAAVAGIIGAFPALSIENFVIGKPGEPLGAFIAAYIAIEIGTLIAGKTKLDIILTPLVCIITGAVAGYLMGPPISQFMNWLGNLVNINVEKSPIIGGMIVSVLMGIILTLPISSAAIGVSMKISGLAAGAAVVGCCCNMIGFAIASYKDNKLSGAVAQGLGTSMIQIPNIMKKPVIWLPAIISSAIMGPISSAVFKMLSTPVGSGMGTSGLVGQFATYEAMTAAGVSPTVTILEIALVHFILPAALSLVIAIFMRKLKILNDGDMRLEINS